MNNGLSFNYILENIRTYNLLYGTFLAKHNMFLVIPLFVTEKNVLYMLQNIINNKCICIFYNYICSVFK